VTFNKMFSVEVRVRRISVGGKVIGLAPYQLYDFC